MFLVVTAAAGAACSGQVSSVADRPTDQLDGSSSDATMAITPDHIATDGGPDVENAVEDAADEWDALLVSGPPPALLPDAASFTCPTTIDDALSSSSGQQTGRLSRAGLATTCAITQPFPGTGADPTNPHLYQAYRFANTTAAASCFTFTLTYGATPPDADAQPENDASVAPDGSIQNDAGVSLEASAPNDAAPAPPRIMSAYSTFYPDNLATGYLGFTGSALTSPLMMSITVPAGETIDVVVQAVDEAPAGTGPFTLSCAAQ